MPFSDRLKTFRKRSGMTQEALAEKVGVAKSTIAGYENGNREPDVLKIKKLAFALGVTGDDLLGTAEIEKAPSMSDEAKALVFDFQRLDCWGRKTVKAVVAAELERVQDKDRFLRETDPEEEPKVINLFLEPSAAGLALGETGQLCEPYELRETDPPNASYAIRIQGDSMEPDFPDGSIAFVCHDEMRDGDIGVFCVDGATVVKQWHFDRVLGVTHLFSLNRARADADLVITGGRSAVWQGKVITPKRYPLPGR